MVDMPPNIVDRFPIVLSNDLMSRMTCNIDLNFPGGGCGITPNNWLIESLTSYDNRQLPSMIMIIM